MTRPDAEEERIGAAQAAKPPCGGIIHQSPLGCLEYER